MKTSNVTRYTLSVCVAALTFTGCGGASTTPITEPLRTEGSAFDAAVSKSTIYVANLGGDKVTAYSPKGKHGKLTLTITTGINGPFGVAVDKNGKIFVTNTSPYYPGGNVTSYASDGKQTTPTITAGIDFPLGIVVTKSGKIYVANLRGPTSSGSGSINTYKPDGTQTTPTITAGIAGPVGVTLDDRGKIYVANAFNNSVTTYRSDGTQTTPTITAGLNFPEGIAVDANGKIYVVNHGGVSSSGSITTYTADGTQTTPTITAGIEGPV
ncbi:MAG: NHL repeat-containing protein, partial [Candidatus Cybelea sp.]